MKKVLLTSAAVLAVFASAAPAFAATATFKVDKAQNAVVVTDENGAQHAVALKDGKADLSKYGLGVVEVDGDTPSFNDVAKKEVEEAEKAKADKAKEDAFKKAAGLDGANAQDVSGNTTTPSTDNTKPSDNVKPSDETKPSDNVKPSDETKPSTDDKGTPANNNGKPAAPSQEQVKRAKDDAAKVAKAESKTTAAKAKAADKKLPNTAAVK